MKELPKMYQNKINKKIDSIQKVYSTFDESSRSTLSNTKYSNISIDKKIDDIFKAPD